MLSGIRHDFVKPAYLFLPVQYDVVAKEFVIPLFQLVFATMELSMAGGADAEHVAADVGIEERPPGFSRQLWMPSFLVDC